MSSYSFTLKELLQKEINDDREKHNKKPLKRKDDDKTNPPSSNSSEKTIKESTSDPESGCDARI